MKDSRFLPFRLVPLLDGYQGIAFFCLLSRQDLVIILHFLNCELTFSSFRVFLELLLGSRMSLVPLTAAMVMAAFLQLRASFPKDLRVDCK